MKKGLGKVILGVILMVTAAVIVITAAVSIFGQLWKTEKTFAGPGTVEVTIREPGKYYLWNSYRITFENKSYNQSKSMPEGTVAGLKNNESGQVIGFNPNRAFSLSSGDEARVSIGYFDIQRTGKYDLTVAGFAETRIFSWGKSEGSNIVSTAISIIGIDMILTTGAVILIIVGLRQMIRKKSMTETTSCPPPVK